MKQKRFEWDRFGAFASSLCAVHCLITGVAFGLLSVVNLSFFGSIWTDICFFGLAISVGLIAVPNGFKQHRSPLPGLLFLAGLVSVVLGHFVFGGHDTRSVNVLATIFSVGGGLSLVAFHVLNLRMQRKSGTVPSSASPFDSRSLA